MLIKFFLQQLLLIVTIILLLVLVFPSWALGKEDLEFVQVHLGGSGCPEGSYQISRTDDQQTMAILFDNFLSEVPQYQQHNDNQLLDMVGEATEDDFGPHANRPDNPRLDHKVCQIIIGSKIPAGMKVQSVAIVFDYRGAVEVSPFARAVFASAIILKKGMGTQLGGSRQNLWKKRWMGRNRQLPVAENWSIRQTQQIVINSRCSRSEDQFFTIGLQNIMRTSLLPQADLQKNHALLVMDSVDTHLGVFRYQIQLESCGPH